MTYEATNKWQDYVNDKLAGGSEPTVVTWDDVTGKPATFPPTIGTTAVTAMAGNAKPATAVAADTAAKLTTARAITLTGAVTGTGNFDGSAPLSITTTDGA